MPAKDFPKIVHAGRMYSDAYGTEFYANFSEQEIRASAGTAKYINEQALLSDAACEAVAKLDYEGLVAQPFGGWENVPEKYKSGFMEQAKRKLEAALVAVQTFDIEKSLGEDICSCGRHSVKGDPCECGKVVGKDG